MSKVSHTPGPWTIRYGFNVFGTRRDVKSEGSVATCGGYQSNQVDCGPENEANARLVAAAPDLLAACVRLLESSLVWRPEHPECSGDEERIRESKQAEAMARAAIAKATGEDSP